MNSLLVQIRDFFLQVSQKDESSLQHTLQPNSTPWAKKNLTKLEVLNSNKVPENFSGWSKDSPWERLPEKTPLRTRTSKNIL